MRPNGFYVDGFPFLKYVPGYASYLKQWHQDEIGLYRRQLQRVEDELASGDSGPSFARYLIENPNEHGLSEGEMAYLSGAFYGAGADTTAVAITIMVMAAARFPEAQAKVQEELDEVIGHGRAPSFADQSLLPQLQAWILETLRWRPVVLLGFCHRATKDIVWNNFLIPSGTTVLGNHWTISRDAKVFPNPETFDPQRWLDDNGQVRDNLKFFSFGFGRRVCPGQQVGHRSLFITAALLLWAFKLSEDPSAPIDDKAFSDGVVAFLQPFTVKFEPRFEEGSLRTMME
ncbi:hypothetical protein SERLA73DRAFT_190371 [Serpula lacrymans var. lacrymans S7.3]|uniref:Cytochrome P450 n=2 Tax=Serpula lacrymans var. lacrymans TaxID=341189 RepID=F8QFK0_SERL3|nr:hypothetical protein SERLA73DRAFT_190371 [Serpula lacrymans var. lacrymans S7.3]